MQQSATGSFLRPSVCPDKGTRDLLCPVLKGGRVPARDVSSIQVPQSAPMGLIMTSSYSCCA